MSVFKLQSLLSIVLDTKYSSLASAEVKQILYQKPDGTKGAWEATNSGTTLIYNLQNGDIDQSGMWKLQTYIEVGGLKGPGNIIEKHFEPSLLP